MGEVSVVRVEATLGAVVQGVDLRTMDATEWATIEAAFNEHALLIFPGQHLDDDEQMTFGLRFGPLEKIGHWDGIVPLTNRRADGRGLLDERDPMMLGLKGNEEWHTDSSYVAVSAKASVLSARVVPSRGGQTEWVDMRAAYDALPETMKQRITGLSARHSYVYSQGKLGHQVESWSYASSSPSDPRRPLVKVHPVTGRPSLFIGRHAFGIEGLTDADSEQLLNGLLEFACQPPRLYAHDWRVGDVAVWDNRCVLHRVQPWDPTEVRSMVHTRISGDPATEGAEMSTNPSVRGPLPGPAPIPAGLYDLEALGYVEEEFFLAGTADSYSLVGDRSSDGRWEAKPHQPADFTSRLQVRRPVDPARFSGTVIVEWLNVSAGADGGPDWGLLHNHIIRRGHAWVGVSAQKAGIDGGGYVEGMHLKKAFPERYNGLVHPGDAWSFDIFTQAGRALRQNNGTPPLGPLTPIRVLAAGESQSAMFLVTYINAIDALAEVYDGFLVHGRGAAGASLDNQVGSLSAAGEAIRQDTRVPVLVLQSETDVVYLGGGRADQLDGPRLRLWEIAGAAHADTYLLVASGVDDGHLPAEQLADLLRPTNEVIGLRTASPINAAPQQHYVGHAALEHLEQWVVSGTAPASAPRLDLAEDGQSFSSDRFGIATGGLRTPWVDVPTARYSGLGQTGEVFAVLFGSTVPFDETTLQQLYPGGPADYLSQFERSLDEVIAGGFLLAEDRAEILALAAASYRLDASGGPA